jgi:hypothetical protein
MRVDPIRRRIAALAGVVAVLFLLPGIASATITGPCHATGTSTSGTADFATDNVWHLKSTDTAGGSGQSDVKMTSASVVAYALGIPIPIASGSGNGDTSGSVSGVSVATYAILAHRFVVHGEAHGEANCSGDIEVIIDDVNPLLTILGGGGALAAIVGLVLVVLFARSSGGCLLQLLAALFGGLGGAGLGLALEQFDVLDPQTLIGLAIAIVCALLGFALCGRLAPSPAVAA